MFIIRFLKRLFSRKKKTVDSVFLKYEDVVYGKGYVNYQNNRGETKNLLMDMYYPPDHMIDVRETFYPIVLIHGGRFKEGDKQDKNLIELIDMIMSHARNVMCVSINYRLLGDSPPAPLQFLLNTKFSTAVHSAIVDVKTVLRYLYKHSDKYKLKNDFIIIGESAGAVAGITATFSNKDEYVLDKTTLPALNDNNYSASAYNIKGVVSLWGSGSLVLKNIKDSPIPILVLHGDKDSEMSVSYLDGLALHKASGNSELITLKDGGHGPWDKYKPKIHTDCINFIQYILKNR